MASSPTTTGEPSVARSPEDSIANRTKSGHGNIHIGIEAGELNWLNQDQPGLHCKTLSQRLKKTRAGV